MAKKKVKKRASGDHTASFEESLSELEQIVGDLESGQLGLEDALARYESGVKHLKSCFGLLERAERKIELLSGIDAAGNPVTEPFDDESGESLPEKAASRGKRRSHTANQQGSARVSKPGNVDEERRLF